MSDPNEGAGGGGGGAAPEGNKDDPNKDALDTGNDPGDKGGDAGDVLSGDGGAGDEGGAPEEYTLTLPEGFSEDLLDGAALDEYKALAKEAGLSQDQFQKLAEYDLKRTQEQTDKAVEQWSQRVKGWREAARADKDFGGESYDANVKTALTAVEKFGDAEFKALIKSPSKDNPNGLAVGNHPAMLRFLKRIGDALADPTIISGGPGGEGTEDARLRKLYPSMYD